METAEETEEVTYPIYIFMGYVGLIFGIYLALAIYFVYPIYILDEDGIFPYFLQAIALGIVYFFVKFILDLKSGKIYESRAKKYIATATKINSQKEKGKYYSNIRYIGVVIATYLISGTITAIGFMAGGFGNFVGAFGVIMLVTGTKRLLTGELHTLAKKDYFWMRSQKNKNKNKKIEGAVQKITPLIDEDDEVTLYTTSLAELGSYANPKQQKSGYEWSGAKSIFEASKNKTLYLDNFAFSDEMKEEIKDKDLNFEEEDMEILTNVENNIDPLDLTKTLLLVGAMGSGKSEAITSLIEQKLYNRCLVSDIKGSFVETLYRQDEDIILSMFDERSDFWDIFEEMKFNPEVASSFVKNLVKASVSDKGEGDFFSNQASKIITENFMKTAYQKDLTSIEKWEALVQSLEKYLSDADGGGDKTKSSIALTMDLSMEIFKMITYRAKNGAKGFTITEFLERSDGQKLFLLNNPAYSSKLTPFFTGFIGAFVSVVLGKPDTKTDFTLTILDEFYSLTFDQDTKTKLLTMGRSKGMQLVIGTQYLDARKDRQVLESSRYAMMVFALADTDTVKRVGEMLGEVTYKEDVASVSRDWGTGGNPMGAFTSVLTSGNKYSHTEQERKKQFLDPKKLQSMPAYHHITIIPSTQLIYLGYTKLVDLEKTNASFVPIQMEKYYEYLYSDLNSVSSLSFKNEKSDTESSIDHATEEEMFVHWMKLRFPENADMQTAYMKEHNFNTVNIDKLFEMFEEDMEVVKEAKERYTDEERYRMIDEFFALNDNEKYHYAKNKKILRTLMSVFGLSSAFIMEKMQNIEKMD